MSFCSWILVHLWWLDQWWRSSRVEMVRLICSLIMRVRSVGKVRLKMVLSFILLSIIWVIIFGFEFCDFVFWMGVELFVL